MAMGDYSKPRQKTECEFYTVKDMATLLGVSTKFVYVSVGTTELPPNVRIGDLIKFPKDKYIAWKKARLTGETNV